jgi:hypothetical protein
MRSIHVAAAVCAGIDAVSQYLKALGDDDLETPRGKLCIGLQHSIEVTDAPTPG